MDNVSEYYKNKGYSKIYHSINKENRHVVTLSGNGVKSLWMTYGKYIYTSHYKCDVQPGDNVDHINGDKTDDRLENLQIISGKYNRQKDLKRGEMVACVCPICGEEFLFPKRSLSTHPNPCCSRQCGGKKAVETAKKNYDGYYLSRLLIRDELKDKIIELRKQGLSSYKIAEQIKTVSRSTIDRFLRSNKL